MGDAIWSIAFEIPDASGLDLVCRARCIVVGQGVSRSCFAPPPRRLFASLLCDAASCSSRGILNAACVMRFGRMHAKRQMQGSSAGLSRKSRCDFALLCITARLGPANLSFATHRPLSLSWNSACGTRNAIWPNACKTPDARTFNQLAEQVPVTTHRSVSRLDSADHSFATRRTLPVSRNSACSMRNAIWSNACKTQNALSKAQSGRHIPRRIESPLSASRSNG